jgi:hypothetical protein
MGVEPPYDLTKPLTIDEWSCNLRGGAKSW